MGMVYIWFLKGRESLESQAVIGGIYIFRFYSYSFGLVLGYLGSLD